jgi:cephalosporin hydroxylase
MSLTSIAEKSGTDKLAQGFIDIYQQYFSTLQDSAQHVLEIGIWQGASHLMWQEYFSNASIYGIDFLKAPSAIKSLSVIKERGINVEIGDQSKRGDLQTALQGFNNPQFDIIIDDGGHTMEQQQVTLGYLFPHLKSGGLFIVEDLHTSYLPNFGFSKKENNGSCQILENFILTGSISSPYMTEEETLYLEDKILQCKIHRTRGDNSCITSILTKK